MHYKQDSVLCRVANRCSAGLLLIAGVDKQNARIMKYFTGPLET